MPVQQCRKCRCFIGIFGIGIADLLVHNVYVAILAALLSTSATISTFRSAISAPDLKFVTQHASKSRPVDLTNYQSVTSILYVEYTPLSTASDHPLTKKYQ